MPEPPGEPAPEPPGEPAPKPPAAADPAPPGRPIGVRMARLHLRTGSLALARAELESLAGHASLDGEALVDLAEVRWRTGDLAGAAEAANAAISNGSDALVVLVIAAEAVAAVGRPGEARRLAARAMQASDGSLDPVFAGMPRDPMWPTDPIPESADLPTDLVAQVPPRSGRARAARGGDGPASTGAAEAFAGGRGALAAGDRTTAAVRLGVAIRLDPGFALGVLGAVGERPSDPALALVAGDALRLLGRESEALEAYNLARGRPEAGSVSAPDDRPEDDGD